MVKGQKMTKTARAALSHKMKKSWALRRESKQVFTYKPAPLAPPVAGDNLMIEEMIGKLEKHPAVKVYLALSAIK